MLSTLADDNVFAKSVIPLLCEKIAAFEMVVANCLIVCNSTAGSARYNCDCRIILSGSLLYACINNSQVCLARFAGLLINASIFTFRSSKRFAISGASFNPLAFNGRSKSFCMGLSQLLLAWRIRRSDFISLKVRNHNKKNHLKIQMVLLKYFSRSGLIRF